MVVRVPVRLMEWLERKLTPGVLEDRRYAQDCSRFQGPRDLMRIHHLFRDMFAFVRFSALALRVCPADMLKKVNFS